ncbi:DEAD/DEAH box helicase [candidate division KSB1 bacterium]|nr:DEAD/DEAH box helicase [candidate division KSB1 bacterium]
MKNDKTSLEPLAETSLDQLPRSMQEAAARAGWTSLMPVQSKAIPYLLANRNMMVQARTGSGKTGAFLLPMLEKLDPQKNVAQALVLVPTRELAKQVVNVAEVICQPAGFRTVAVYGGVGYGNQIKALKQGAHIIVGTPGRVLDHLLKGTMNLDKIHMLIFDEADRMLSMGFYPDMKKIKNYLPDRSIHNCLFSATFPSQVKYTASEFIHNPEFISLSEGQVHVTDTEHVFYTVPGMDKDRSLVRIIEIENPTSAIIFCNTKAEVHYVTVVLQKFGYDADELTSDLAQSGRERVLERVRRRQLRFLVATDVAARGLDLPELSHVIQYEPPEDFEAYIHRAGRTGRAGAAGVAISLVNNVERFALDRIAKRYDIDMQERELPDDEDVQAIVSERLTALLEARLRERNKLQAERSKRFVPLARELSESEDESAIIAMLLDDYYQQLLHSAPPGPIPEPESATDRKPPKPRSSRSGGRQRRRSKRSGRGKTKES